MLLEIRDDVHRRFQVGLRLRAFASKQLQELAWEVASLFDLLVQRRHGLRLF